MRTEPDDIWDDLQEDKCHSADDVYSCGSYKISGCERFEDGSELSREMVGEAEGEL